MLLRVLLFFALGLAITFKSLSQSDFEKIKLVAKTDGQIVHVRWAPKNEDIWKKCNQSGYEIVRFNIAKTDGLVRNSEPIILSSGLRPYDLSRWSELSDDNYALIAAQSLYGQEMQLDIPLEDDPYQAYQVSRQGELRFSFALLAADRSLQVASYSGLYLSDTVPSEISKVYYKVGCLHETEQFNGDVVVDLSDSITLPIVEELSATNDAVGIIVSWKSPKFYSYSYYNVYRKMGGIRELLSNPIVQTTADSEKMYFVDTLSGGNSDVKYVVAGVDLFGEEGPVSETIYSGTNLENLQVHIRQFEVRDDSVYVIAENSAGLDSITFRLNDAITGTGRSFKIATNVSSTYTLPIQKSSYLTATVHSDLTLVSSMPVYVHIPDNDPPERLQGIRFQVDSMNNVELTWEAIGDDIRGVRIYRSFEKEGPFVQITSKPVSTESVVDSLALNMTKVVYYRLQQEDHSYNRSELSDILEIELNTKKKSPLRFSHYYVEENSVALRWTSSVDHNGVYLVTMTEEDTSKVFVKGNSYLDQVNSSFVTYALMLKEEEKQAQDTLFLQLSNRDSKSSVGIKPNRSERRVEISLPDDLTRVVIYRGLDGQSLRTLKSYQDPEKVIFDYDLTINTEYQYRFELTNSVGEVYLTPRQKVTF